VKTCFLLHFQSHRPPCNISHVHSTYNVLHMSTQQVLFMRERNASF